MIILLNTHKTSRKSTRMKVANSFRTNKHKKSRNSANNRFHRGGKRHSTPKWRCEKKQM